MKISVRVPSCFEQATLSADLARVCARPDAEHEVVIGGIKLKIVHFLGHGDE